MYSIILFIHLFKDFIYLFMRDTRERESRDTGRERSRLLAGSPMWDWIPGPRDHALSQRQMLNLLSHPSIPDCVFNTLYILTRYFLNEW